MQTTRRGWTFPPQIYSAPMILTPDRPLSMADALRHLTAAGYASVEGGPLGPGQYQATERTLFLVRRPFDYPGKLGFGNVFDISFFGGRVERIIDHATGDFLDTLTLDPVPLGTFSSSFESRKWIPLRDLPDTLVKAVIAIEDRRFYSHHGVDPRGIARAVKANLRAGGIKQGASTITQQLARNLFLTRRRTMRRKAVEIGIALVLERRYDKSDILEMYLNQIYLGQRGPVGVFGVEEASQLYFGKKSADLTLAESALLAGLIRAPNLYSPFTRPDLAGKRRDTVLKTMFDQGIISREELDRAAIETVAVTPAERGIHRRAPYFVSYMHTHLAARYNPAALNTQGYSVFTTLDLRLQSIAEDVVKRSSFQAALVAIDPRTGDILAMVGGRDFAASQFNRAVQAKRQPGSTFKPFVLAAALENGLTLISQENDSPLSLADWTDTWTPQNYDTGVFRGPVTAREMIVHSLNIPTARLGLRVGPDKVVDVARRLGIESPLLPVPSLALGSMEVTLLELTRAYSAFATTGLMPATRSVVSVRNHRGESVEENGVVTLAVLNPAVAWLVHDVLTDVVKEGTGRWAKDWGFRQAAAGKTGTNDSYKDAWFVGYTPELLCGVWVGHDLPRPLKLTGAQVALPIWAQFMARALEGRDDVTVPQPPGLVEAGVDLETGELSRMGCVRVRREVFIEGTEPKVKCRLHAGGIGGWLKKIFRF